MNVLFLHSSLGGDASATRAMAAAYRDRLKQQHPDATLVERDFALDPPPHLPEAMVPVQLGGQATEEAALSDQLIRELEAADVVAIGAPMYNFTVPSTLKAWIDHVMRVRRTFMYQDGRPLGLLPPGKKAIVFTASGGVYTEGPAQAMDFLEPYLRVALGFIGIDDVRFVRAEAQGMPDRAAAARAAANECAGAMV